MRSSLRVPNWFVIVWFGHADRRLDSDGIPDQVLRIERRGRILTALVGRRAEAVRRADGHRSACRTDPRTVAVLRANANGLIS
mgnify:CR=1 FL=1